MATSGTVSTTVFETRKIIDLAFRRCRLLPQQITPERIDTAQDLLYLMFSQLAAEGITLWTLPREILPLYTAKQSVPTPVGTVNVLDCNLRKVQRLTGTATASEGTAENAFDGDLETACTQVADAGWIQVQYTGTPRVPIFGILPNASGTWSITLQGSNDGVSFTTFYTNTELAAVAGEWFWTDIEGMAEWEYIRLQAAAGTVLDVTEFFTGNQPNEIPIALINRDDYDNLPDKTFLSRPTMFWFDRQRIQPVITLWPAPAEEYTFYQLLARVQRYIQDVGTMTQEVEMPQRWLLPTVEKLASEIALSDKEVDPNWAAVIVPRGEASWTRALSNETDDAPAYLRPNIRPYTA